MIEYLKSITAIEHLKMLGLAIVSLIALVMIVTLVLCTLGGFYYGWAIILPQVYRRRTEFKELSWTQRIAAATLIALLAWPAGFTHTAKMVGVEIREYVRGN